MKKLNIALVTDDRPYARALVRGLNDRSRNLTTSVYSTSGFIGRWKEGGLSYRQGFDLILWDGSEGERIRGGNIVWITQVPDGGDMVLYRYDRASVIYAGIMDIYDGIAGRKGNEDQKDPPRRMTGGETSSRVIAFGSCRGGSGCTRLSMDVARELARFFGKRVFWMSLDGIDESPVDPMDEKEPVRDVDYYLYSVLDPERKSAVDIDRYMVMDGYGVCSLGPSHGRNPLPLLTGKEASGLIDSLAEEGTFDALIIDSGDCCSEAAGEMMARADRICILKDERNGMKRERYMNWMGNLLGEDTDDRLVETSGTGGEGDGKNIHALAETLWYNEMDHSLH